MTIRQLRAFVTVASTLNFAQACEILFISQPALSLTIKNLEEALGGELFQRTTRTVVLSPEGQEFLPKAKQILADFDNAIDSIQQRFNLKRGTISIAAMPSFASNALPHILKLFKDKFQNINITIHDVIHEKVLEMVSQNRVELGLVLEPEATESFQFIPLLDDNFVAVIPKNFVLETFEEINWEQLLKYDFIALQRPSLVRSLLEAELTKSNLKLRISYDCHQVTTIGRMVANGLGVSAVPAICQQQMQELGCICIPLHSPVIKRRIGIISSINNQLSSASLEMIKIMKSHYQSLI
jgi:LysR family carnitine catabolism transcriptional activator